MGLDMYIEAKRYLSDFDPKEKEISEKIKAMIGEVPGIPAEHSFVGRVQEVVVQAAYWRKANHIHAWFVKHCQEGRDECQTTYISRDMLKKLVDVCKTVLAVRLKKDRIKLAEEILPPQAGFFFGSTEVDEWYFSDVKDTIKQLEPLLDEKWHNEWSFYYRASW
jgi:hypothetical protein